MIIPTVIPIKEDELLNGWIERLAEANHMPIKQFLEKTFDLTCPKYNVPSPIVRKIRGLEKIVSHPSLRGLNLNELFIKHTILPAETLFMDLYNSSMYIETMIHARDLTTTLYFQNLLQQLKYCPLCIKEDISSYGYPIVHVPHQYKSVTACWKHGITLVDNIEDIGIHSSSPEEKKVALFMKALYDKGFLGHINVISSAWFDSIIEKIPELRESGAFKRALDFAGIKSEKSFFMMLTSVRQPFPCRTKITRALSQLIDIDTLDTILKPEPISQIIAECTTSLAAAGSELVSFKYPFAVVRCGHCSREYISYHYSIRIESGCPYCSDISGSTATKERMLDLIVKRDGFTCMGNGFGTLVKYKHSCGKIINAGPKHILYSGHLSCPVCDETTIQYASTRLLHTFERIGTRRVMKNGFEAEIIAYHDASNIDLKFENGLIRHHVTYRSFLEGKASAYKTTVERKNAEYVGRKKEMKSGLIVEIINYCGGDHIDVKFENGIIHRNVSMSQFRNGKISLRPVEKWIDAKKIMTCGLEATIIAYRSAYDIDVLFETGEILHGVPLKYFKKCTLRPACLLSKKKENRIGETNEMSCGLKGTIVEYRNSNDLDIRFEDGTVRRHVTYHGFKEGIIKPVAKKRNTEPYLGLKRKMHCGLEAEIIEYRNSNDLDIRFEDGTVRRHVTYGSFRKSLITSVPHSSYAERRIGEKRKMHCGLEAEIIDYKGFDNIDIRFEDGTIRKHVLYSNFKKGKILPLSGDN